MNIIETLPKSFEKDGILYGIEMHVTAFDKLCICYRSMISAKKEILCSVCVEPENKPVKIEDTIGCVMNEYVGNAQNLDNAAIMLKDFVKNHYNI